MSVGKPYIKEYVILKNQDDSIMSNRPYKVYTVAEEVYTPTI